MQWNPIIKPAAGQTQHAHTVMFQCHTRETYQTSGTNKLRDKQTSGQGLSGVPWLFTLTTLLWVSPFKGILWWVWVTSHTFLLRIIKLKHPAYLSLPCLYIEHTFTPALSNWVLHGFMCQSNGDWELRMLFPFWSEPAAGQGKNSLYHLVCTIWILGINQIG